MNAPLRNYPLILASILLLNISIFNNATSQAEKPSRAPSVKPQSVKPQSVKTQSVQPSGNPFDSALDSLSQLTSQIQEGLTLNPSDGHRIKHSGSTYYIPEDLKQKALLSIPSLSSQVDMRRITHHINNKNVVLGFQIIRIAAKSIIHSLGIKAGDIIQSVNGHPLTSEDDGFALLSKLEGAQTYVVELLRGSNRERYQLSYKLVS